MRFSEMYYNYCEAIEQSISEKVERPLTEEERRVIQNVGSLMMLESFEREVVSAASPEQAMVLFSQQIPLSEERLALTHEQLIEALSSPHQAIWLVPTDVFCEQGRRERWAAQAQRQQRHGLFDETRDPEQRRRNVIARDCQLARIVRQQAQALQLPIYEVDTRRSREEMTELVERHFDPYLIECFRRLRK